MEKLNLEITDRKFSPTDSTGYELSVLAGTDGLSFLASDEAGTVLAVKSWNFVGAQNRVREVESAIRNIIAGDEKLNLKYGKIRFSVFNNLVTLVPNRLFNPGDLPSYFNLLLRTGQNLTYHFDDLPEQDAKLPFAVDSGIAHLASQYFPQAKIAHSSTALLKAWQKLAKRNDYDVFVNLRNHIAQIAIFDRKHLLFFNAFTYLNASDFLYFVLLAYDQMRISPLESPLILSGEIMEDSDICRLLFRYVREVKFVQLPDHYAFPGAVQALPGHWNFDLYSLKQY